MLPRLVLLVYILVKFSCLLLTNHNVHLVNIKGTSYFQQRHYLHYWAAVVQHASAYVHAKGEERQNNRWKRHALMCTCRRDSTVQKGKKRKQGERKEKTTALWWRKDEWVWHLQHSQIKCACHASWMVRDWLSLRSLGPATILSYPVLTTAGCKNVRNVNDAPTGELENRSWQEQVKNKKVNNRWKEGGQSKQKSTNRSSSFVNDVYS